MSGIHYFPRYSQKENMVTNNTLLLFNQLYNNSTDKFKRLINLILEESGIEIDTTVTFKQQEKGKGSIPDAIIEQESFKVVIETKLYGQQNIEQLANHFNYFSHEDKQVFLWVNKEPITAEYRQEIIDRLNSFNTVNDNKICFASTTFRSICRCFKDILNDYDIELKELVDDFESFCSDSALIDNTATKMRVILASATFQQNLEYSIYYAPKERGFQQHKYLGLYKDKAVRAIGEVIGFADYNYDFGSDTIKTVETHLISSTEEQELIIKKVIVEAKDKFGFDIAKGHRFFFVKKYYKTDFIKPTKGGLMGQKYFDLAEIKGFDENMSTLQIAEFLKGKEWN